MNALERITAIQVAMVSDQPPPADVRGFELVLCGLLGQLAKDATLAEIEFKRVIAASRTGAKSIAEAKVCAEAQPAYGTWRLAQMAHEQCYQIIVTCRGYSRSVSEEMRLSR